MIRRKRVDVSHVGGGGMEDVNEQELAKSVDGQQLFEETDTNTDSASASACPTPDSDKENIEEKPSEEIKLPISVPEPSEIVELPPPTEEPEPCSDDMADETPDDEDDAGEDEPPEHDEKRHEHHGKSGKIYVAIIAACLALSLVLMALTYMERSDEPVETKEGEASLTDTEDVPTQTAPAEEPLSASLIYQTRKNTSVTVTATGKTGKRYLSGTAVLGNGHIATVYSGVADADRVEVTLSDGKTYAATVIGGDATVDLALLKTDAQGLEYIEPSASPSLGAGKRLYAIGTAEEAQFCGSLFEGVVAFGERSLELSGENGEMKRATAIQVGGFGDSALCGCPVFDEYGVAVAMVWSGTDGASVSLALPLDRVMTVLEFFKNGETPAAEVLKSIAYTAPSLGIVGQNGSSGEIYGVLITDFSQPTCDAAAQLRKGDVIFMIGETLTADTTAVKQAIYLFAPGDKVEVHVIRDGQRLSYFIELV